MLEKGTRENWFDSMLIVRLAIAAALGIGFFIWWELRVKQPVVNLRVLRHRGFAAGTLFAMVLGFALYGGIFVLPVFLQELRNYTPMQTGIIMLPGALSAGAMMPFAARLTSRVSPRFMVLLGLMGTVGTMLMFHHLTLDSGPEQILLPMILRGLCMGLLFLPLILITLSGLKGLEIAQGTAFFNLSRQMGGSIGIAYLSTFLLNRTSFHYDRLREGLTVYNPITTLWLHRVMGGFMAHGSPAVVAKQQALGALAGSVFTQASILSYDDIFGLMAVLLVLAMPLLLLFERGKKMRERMHAPAE
jgi:DHA2 family multidrug resistance protein